LSLANNEQKLVLECNDESGHLSPWRQVPLGHGSDDELTSLIENQRGTKPFVHLSFKDWNMIQAYPLVQDMDQAELAAFELAFRTQYENQGHDGHFDLEGFFSQYAKYQRLMEGTEIRKAE